MINNIPTCEDFYTTGRELLDIAWDMTAKLLVNLDEAEYYGIDTKAVSEEYWRLADRQITTALAITQQGIELLIKGRICEVSPFLLIADPPAKWPSQREGETVEFSKFRTLDAQDLIQVHDTCSPIQFDSDFVNKFNELRQTRNIIMHSPSRSLDVQVGEVIDALLQMHNSLFPNVSWAKVRKNALEFSPNTALESNDFISNEINRELSLIIKLLKPSKVAKYFKIDKKNRAYLCPECYYQANRDADDFEYKNARLLSKDKECRAVYCPVCDLEYIVTREKCLDGDCLGNVMSDLHGMCLTCGYH